MGTDPSENSPGQNPNKHLRSKIDPESVFYFFLQFWLNTQTAKPNCVCVCVLIYLHAKNIKPPFHSLLFLKTIPFSSPPILVLLLCSSWDWLINPSFSMELHPSLLLLRDSANSYLLQYEPLVLVITPILAIFIYYLLQSFLNLVHEKGLKSLILGFFMNFIK